MDAIRDEYLAISAREEGLSARKIIRHHQYCIESLARPAYRRLFWGPMWLVGEAPKRSHVAACQSFSRLAHVWRRLQLRMPVEFRDLTERPMPKSYSRWGDMRPRRIDSALGGASSFGRRLVCAARRQAICSWSSWARQYGRRSAHSNWISIAGTVCRDRRVCLASCFWRRFRIPRHWPHGSLTSFVCARLLDEVQSARVRRPTRSRGFRHVERLGLMPLDE